METKNIEVPKHSIKLKGSSGKIYKESFKFDKWVSLVLDQNNKRTFGNFTQGAITAYSLDEKDITQYNMASAIGSQNYRKLKDIASLTLQKKGVTFGFLIDVLMAKMHSSQSSTWWEIVMEMMGYRDRAQVNVNQYNQNNNYLAVNDEQLKRKIEDFGSESLREEALAEVLVEGDLARENEQVSSVEIHSEELRNEDRPE